MGVLLTSARAARAAHADPAAYTASLDLDESDRAALIAMSGDLVGLSPGFVVKRKRMLANMARRTLALVGHEAQHWLDEYVETHPPVELRDGDGERWLGWLVDRVATAASDLPHPGVVLDLARLDRQHLLSFRTPAPTGGAGQGRLLAVDRLVRLHPSADLLHLDWDVLGLAAPTPDDAAHVLPADIDLLVFRNRAGRVVTERVEDPDLFDVIVELASGAMPLGDILSMADDSDLLLPQLQSLFRRGAVVQ